MTRLSLVPLAACAALALSGAALAQGTALQRAACTPDVMRLCSADIPNVEKIVICLRRERVRLSNACQGVFDALDGQRMATRAVTIDTTPSTAWCNFGPDSPSGQDVWRAWCAEMRRRPN